MSKIPLLKDNHNHFFAYASMKDAIDLSLITDKTKALELFSNSLPTQINIAKRWFDNYFTISKVDLEDLSHPIIVCNNSLHKYVFNTKAERFIARKFPEWVENNDNQEWVEKNIMNIFSFLAGINNTDEQMLKEYNISQLQSGILESSDMFVTDTSIIDFISNNKNSFNIDIYTNYNTYEKLNNNQKTVVSGIKLFLDGALGACSAAIEDNYNNGSKGLLTYTNSELKARLEKDFNQKTNIAIHCIGDIAIKQALDCIKEFRNEYYNCNIRLEHAQFITPAMAKQAKDLNVILSMQPNFNMDSVIYADRLPVKYCSQNNPFRMLIDEFAFIPGQDLIFGSDGMPSGIHEAIQQSLFPPVKNQQLNLDEFVNAYCVSNMNKGYIDLDIDIKNKITTAEVHIY